MSSIPRIRLSQKEYELIQSLRGTEEADEERHSALKEYCENNGIPFENVNYYWEKNERFSINVKGDKAPTYFEIRDEIVRSMRSHAPVYKTINRSSVSKDDHL